MDSLRQLEPAVSHVDHPAAAPRVHTGVRNVLLDADDTLWENNIFFLDSIAWLCREGRRLGHTDTATVAILNHWETFNIAKKGYGYDSYEASLLSTVRALVWRSRRWDLHGGLHARALRWTAFLKRHPIVWLPGVRETLPTLVERFRTIVVTKGHQGDQSGKVDRCGLRHLFHGVEVVPHKYPENYRRVLAKYGLAAEETVMVGNSPRSDINMPRRAGLRTVYIPHARSWYREMEPIAPENPPTIEIRRFDEVLDVLAP